MAEATCLTLTVADVAAQLRVSQRTVRRLVARGQIEAVRIGRSVRITPAAIEQLLRDNRGNQFNSLSECRE